jgi:hypothetical protein
VRSVLEELRRRYGGAAAAAATSATTTTSSVRGTGSRRGIPGSPSSRLRLVEELLELLDRLRDMRSRGRPEAAKSGLRARLRGGVIELLRADEMVVATATR